jgi:hypothetical protein
MKRYLFDTPIKEVIVEATTLHTALYRLGDHFEKAYKFNKGKYNFKITLKSIELLDR